MFTTTHLPDHVHDHMTSKKTPATKRLALCLGATLGIKAHRWVPVNTHGTTDVCKGRLWVAQKHHRRQRLDNKSLKHFVEHLHGSGAGSKEPQSCEALSMLGDKNTFRNQQEVPQEIPQENSEKQPDQHVRSGQDAEFDGSVCQEVDLAGH